MKGPWVWLAGWLAVGCLSLPVQAMDYKDGDIPRSVYRNSGSRGYEFEYKVVDSQASWVHSRDEKSDGVSTRGSYAVKLPDGRIQRVTYTADDDGYHPVITYISTDGGGDEGGGMKGYGWKGKSGSFGKVKDSLKIGYTLAGLKEEVVTSPYYPHDLWETSPHHLYDPLRLFDHEYPVYDLHHPFEYYYHPPPLQYDDPYPYYTSPAYLPTSPDSREKMGYRNMKMKQKMDYKMDKMESSEEDNKNLYLNMKTYKPKSSIYVKMGDKTYLGGKKKLSMIQHEEKSTESYESYEEKIDDDRYMVNKAKKHKTDMYDSSEGSNEDMTERMDEYETKEKVDDDDVYSGESKEVKKGDKDTDKPRKIGYKAIHSKSAQHKDMNEYLRKIKRVMARFTTQRTPYKHQSLYRQDTGIMITPRKYIPTVTPIKYIPTKKTDADSSEEENAEDLKGKPHQIGVRMSPPDKPYSMPKHHPPPPPPPPPPSSSIRKHSLNKKPQKAPQDATLHTSAPMLHAPPPPSPSRSPIIHLMPPYHHPHHPALS